MNHLCEKKILRVVLRRLRNDVCDVDAGGFVYFRVAAPVRYLARASCGADYSLRQALLQQGLPVAYRVAPAIQSAGVSI